MQNLLATHYALPYSEPKLIDGITAFKNDEYFYFTMLSDNNKALHMEQMALAYHLFETGYYQTTIPVPNIYGDWTSMYEGKEYILLQLMMLQPYPQYAHGQLLAQFHQVNTSYPYEPKLVSSYGKWKQLWIDKLTVYEEKIKEEAKKYPCPYYEEVMDLLPYMIGLSEDAIQYIQESTSELRFSDVDQGTITFQRYDNQVIDQMLWMNELAYDHPVRDIAEYIRNKLLHNDEQGLEDCWLFLKEYESIRPLSPFSWRMLYARLLFPIHLYDLFEEGFSAKDANTLHKKIIELCTKQTIYEQSLRRLFEVIELNDKSLQIPMLEWL